jgi:hypothetical protein
VDGVDDFGGVDPVEVGRGDAEVDVAEPSVIREALRKYLQVC